METSRKTLDRRNSTRSYSTGQEAPKSDVEKGTMVGANALPTSFNIMNAIETGAIDSTVPIIDKRLNKHVNATSTRKSDKFVTTLKGVEKLVNNANFKDEESSSINKTKNRSVSKSTKMSVSQKLGGFSSENTAIHMSCETDAQLQRTQVLNNFLIIKKDIQKKNATNNKGQINGLKTANMSKELLKTKISKSTNVNKNQKATCIKEFISCSGSAPKNIAIQIDIKNGINTKLKNIIKLGINNVNDNKPLVCGNTESIQIENLTDNPPIQNGSLAKTEELTQITKTEEIVLANVVCCTTKLSTTASAFDEKASNKLGEAKFDSADLGIQKNQKRKTSNSKSVNKSKKKQVSSNDELTNTTHEKTSELSNTVHLETSVNKLNISNSACIKGCDGIKSILPFTSTPNKRPAQNKKSIKLEELGTVVSVKATVDRKRKNKNYSGCDSDEDGALKKKHPRKSRKVVNANNSALNLSNDDLSESSLKQISVDSIQENLEEELNSAKQNVGTSERLMKEHIEKKLKKGLDVMVTCGVCMTEMSNTSWRGHLLHKHNNLAWKIGEPPLDLNDTKLVSSILNDLYRKKINLHCDLCGVVKKSVIGLLSHKTMCKKSEAECASLRVKCKYCSSFVLPVSMTGHLKLCRVYNLRIISKDAEKKSSSSLILEKSKRKAAMKADNLIQSFNEGENDTDYSQAWFKNNEFILSSELLTRIKNDIKRFGSEKCINGCNFITSDDITFAEHYQNCITNLKEELYICKYCVTACPSEDEIRLHIKNSHRLTKRKEGDLKSELTQDDIFIPVEEKSISSCGVRMSIGTIRFLSQSRYCPSAKNVIFPPAYQWTMQFCHQHFSMPNLFSTMKVTMDAWTSLDHNLVYKYLPPIKYSGSVSKITTPNFVDHSKLDCTWKRYKLFESEILDDGYLTIFCGGQIFAMAWLPTPFHEDNVDQILAVCTSSNSMDKLYTLAEVYYETELIQFWNFGILKNDEMTNCKPKLDFCVALDYGPVRCIEWCPSGCYDVESGQHYLKRLGLLAVGCTNSHVYIYSISAPPPNSGKIFKPKPLLKLLFENILDEPVYGVEGHVSKISWTKAAGHQFIAVGYENGLVAVFDLNTKSSLLRMGSDSEGIEMIMPYKIIKAHFHSITALHLFHLNNGQRWLMTGSSDRCVKYWDLESNSTPISVFSKWAVTDGACLYHWISCIHSFDDCSFSPPITSIISQPRNFKSEHISTMYSNCHIWSITGSEWINGFLQGNVMGELQGYFPHQLLAGMKHVKKKKSFMLGYVDIVEKGTARSEEGFQSTKMVIKKKSLSKKFNSSTDSFHDIAEIGNSANLVKSEPLTYKEATEKYGVVFCDINIKSFTNCNEYMNNYTESKPGKFFSSLPNMYPLQSINKVVFNPNHSSYLYVATAYQIGFVRVKLLDFLTK